MVSPVGRLFAGMLAISVDFYLDVLHHSILPALAIVLQAVGFWALGMRGDGDDFG